MRRNIARILVVDDDRTNSMVVAQLLRVHEYAVEVAHDGATGLAALATDAFDLVLLDLRMPDIDGLEVLRQTRARKSTRALPIIIMTASHESADAVAALKLQANDYVTKPVDFTVLLARIEKEIALKFAEQALRESEERYALAMRGANDGLWDWNLHTNKIYYSPRWKLMLGYDEGEIGESADEWLKRVHPEDREKLEKALESHKHGASPHFECQHRMMGKHGTYRWMLSRGVAVRDSDGKATRVAGSQTDVTERTVYDPMTGLPNRILFSEQLVRSLARARRRAGYHYAVLNLHIDNFKIIYDSLGTAQADLFVVAVARRLQDALRMGDSVARLESDEFVVLLDDLRSLDDVQRVAKHLLDTVRTPITIADKEIYPSASIGITQSTGAYEKAEDVLRDALIAAHHAKALGGGRIEMFDTKMQTRMSRRLQLETILRQGIEAKAFRTYYQPVVDADTGTIVGFEALIRLLHPEHGIIAPGEFIPVAEETGLIVQIGAWILEEACRQTAQWKKELDVSLSVSVNLSARQIAQPDIVAVVDEILHRTGLAPESLHLEVTESAMMDNTETARAVLQQFRARGIGVSIDDFGTGYSSLSYLQRFPIDRLKVDRSFVQRMVDEKDSAKIVQTIVMLAQNLGMKVVAEGVETAPQLKAIRDLQCEMVQGFYFSKPVEADTARHLLESSQSEFASKATTNAEGANPGSGSEG